jgi:sulfonate dioxygenase
VRKDAVVASHPLVRIHPVTGERCLFVNSEFITGIDALKSVESKLPLDFRANHIVTGHDFQCRVSWQERTVVVFDNRSTLRKWPFPSRKEAKGGWRGTANHAR